MPFLAFLCSFIHCSQHTGAFPLPVNFMLLSSSGTTPNFRPCLDLLKFYLLFKIYFLHKILPDTLDKELAPFNSHSSYFYVSFYIYLYSIRYLLFMNFNGNSIKERTMPYLHTSLTLSMGDLCVTAQLNESVYLHHLCHTMPLVANHNNYHFTKRYFNNIAERSEKS